MMQERINELLDDIYPPAIRKSHGRVARLKQSPVHHLKTLTSKEKAKAVVKRTPEVMLRIGKANIKSFTHICKCADYIARNGKVDAYDNDGNLLSSKEAYQSVLDRWQDEDNIPDETVKRSFARRLILSMPVGTSEPRFEFACREWAQDCLSGYRYILAFHNDQNDSKTKQPHCHIMLNVLQDGKRLHIDNEKRDIWREHLAVCLNKYGIEANATRRFSRGKTEKSLNQSEHHVKKKVLSNSERARAYAIDKKRKEQYSKYNVVKRYEQVVEAFSNDREIPDHEAIVASKFKRKKLLQRVDAAVDELKKSNDPRDRILAQQLNDHYSNLPPVQSTMQAELRQLKDDKAQQIRRMQAMKARLKNSSSVEA